MGKVVFVVLGAAAGIAAALYLSARRELERAGGAGARGPGEGQG